MFGRAALDLWLAAAVLSLVSVALVFAALAFVSVATVARAARRGRRRPAELGALRQCYPQRELARLDEALERVFAEERGAVPHGR